MTTIPSVMVAVGDPVLLGFVANLARPGGNAKHRLPTIHGLRELAEPEGLMAYAPRLHDQLCRAANFVDKILRGEKPADLPVEQPTKLELVINLKTAEALGLTIPPAVLLRADEVIQ